MQKTIVIKVTPEELIEITGEKVVMDFGTFIEPITKKVYTEEQIESIEEKLMIAISKKYADVSNSDNLTGKYSRIFNGGVSAMFKSNQKMVGEVTFVISEPSM